MRFLFLTNGCNDGIYKNCKRQCLKLAIAARTLSVPGLRGLVSRPQNIQLRYYDPEKKDTSLKVEGFLSTVLQHECDHLDGTLYLDRLSDTKDLSFDEEFLEYNLN